MSVEHGRSLSATINNTIDLHLLDPFAEDTSHLAAITLSEDDHGLLKEPTYKRGSLENAQSQSQSTSVERHVGSMPELEESSSNGNLHPLRSAGLAQGQNDAGVTRPHLSRVLNVGTLVDAPPVANNHLSSPHEARDVFIHVVSPGDSLAGVSLKYGIPLADLRRINHLWASDSIHLRAQLYIPIDKAARLKPITTNNLISFTYDEDSHKNTNSHDVPPIETHQPSSAETICRVPVSQMTFFPPSSVTKSPTTRFPQQHTHTSKVTHYPPYVSHPTNSFTSLLSSLPIAASTRDTIIARLSFDSARSSYSDRDSGAHELDDVSNGSTSDLRRNYDTCLVTPKANDHFTLRATHHTPFTAEQSQDVSPTAVAPVTHSRRLSTSPRSYIPAHPEIRTVQMEPSPEMQIPLLPRRLYPTGKGPSESNLLDTDLELENIT
ncbi:hypothetical protein C0992_005623 [Termitomyces sp. T32_za158]|nr:hypothetical protein C0992_005623 [Termitomyces sp. T32_za158]